MTFQELNIIEPILKALKDKEYFEPTPIQYESIPVLLNRYDILGSAQTGTGKTASFAIPILQNIYEDRKSKSNPKGIKALVLAPTRELALQIYDNFIEYGENLDLKTTVIYGGVPQSRQVKVLSKGVDILVATPGRLLDLVQQGVLSLSTVEYLVLDEADRMLDMGFVRDVKKIVAMVKKKRQTMFFSATMPKSIMTFANEILHNPVRVQVTPVEETVDKIEQSLYFVEKKKKTDLLIKLIQENDMDSVLVFSRTKHGANKIVKQLIEMNINALAIHGNKSQSARQKALAAFKARKIGVLVATDIAARGIDVDELSHVINFDLPEVPETYIHRIGRTGRAGLGGYAISFCSQDQMELLIDIQKHLKTDIPVKKDSKFSIVLTPLKTIKTKSKRTGQTPSNQSKKSTTKKPSVKRKSKVSTNSKTYSNKNSNSSNKSKKNQLRASSQYKGTNNNSNHSKSNGKHRNHNKK